MKRLCALAVLLMLVVTVVFAAPAQKQSAQTQAATGDDFSGMYSFLREGEFVQFSLEGQGKLSGFVSRFGDLPSDKDAFLDQFFKTGSTDGKKVSFTTESVHGTWFEFSGTVSRGPGKTPNDEGYYVIEGKLTKHTEDANKKPSAESRQVTFKSFPQDLQAGPGKRD